MSLRNRAITLVGTVALTMAICSMHAAVCLAETVVAAVRADHPPKIDGVLDEAIWQHEALSNFTAYMQPQAKAPEEGQVWIAYDDEALYVAVRCAESDMKGLKADYAREANIEDRRRDAPEEQKAYADDNLEIFLVPDGRGNDAMFQFVVNPRGALYDILISEGGSRAVDSWQAREIVAAGHIGADFWSVELKIPFGELMLNDNVNADSWRFNVIRNRRRDGKLSMFSLVPLTRKYTDPEPMVRLRSVRTNFAQFRWSIFQPEVMSAKRDGKETEFNVQFRIANNTDRFRTFKVRGLYTDAGGHSIAAEDRQAFDAGQSRSVCLPIRCRTDGIGSLTITIRDFDTGQFLSSAWFSLKLAYEALTLHFSPRYKQGIFASDPKKEFFVWATTVLSNAEWQGGKLRLALRDQNGKLVGEQQRAVKTQEDLAVHSAFCVQGLPYGRYVVEGVLEKDGKQLGRAETAYHLYPPNQGSEIVVDDENRFLINGKRHILIGLCGLPEETARLGGTAMIGHFWLQEAKKEMLGWCAERGLLMAGQPYSKPTNFDRRGPRFALPLSEEERETIRKDVQAVMHNPGVLGYYLVDEPLPAGMGRERFREICEIFRETDPYHITLFSDNTLLSLEKFSPFPDLINFHKYLCPVKGGTFSGDPLTIVNFDRKAKEVTDGLKPVGEFLQIFDYGLDMGGVNSAHINDRSPNYAELRFMTIMRAALDGQTFQYYGVSHYDWFPGNRIGIPAIFKEILSMEDVIVADEKPPVRATPLGKNDVKPIIVLAKKMPEGLTIFAANMNNRAIRGRVECAALGAAGDLQVYSEERKLPFKDGNFEDSFDAYGARIYTTLTRSSPVNVKAVQAEIQAEEKRLLNSTNLAYVGKGTVATSSSVGKESFWEYALHNGYHDDRRAWSAAAKGLPAWVQLDFPKIQTVSEVRLYAKHVRAFRVEVWQDERWNPVAVVEAKTGDPAICAFVPLTTSKVRITVTAAADDLAIIEELELY